MKKSIFTAALLINVIFVLNSCGTKGPLYIPEKQYPQETPSKQ